MWHNIKLNHFMVISGLETLLLGAYLIYVNNVFVEARPDQFHPFMQHAQDPYIAICLVVAGTVAIVVGAVDLNQFKAKRIAMTAMIMIWSSYFFLFVWHDTHSPGPLQFGTILIGFVLVRLFSELAWGDKT